VKTAMEYGGCDWNAGILACDRRGFRGVKRRMHVTVFRVEATLTQARMPAVQSVERDGSVPDF